jgi:hypothetical protein
MVEPDALDPHSLGSTGLGVAFSDRPVSFGTVFRETGAGAQEADRLGVNSRPSDGTDFAYVGGRTTGTQAGDYLITGPGWKGQVPSGMTQISSPNDSVLAIGRVLVYSDSDLPTAYNLAKKIQLTPLSQW